jgi:hypothetical protein
MSEVYPIDDFDPTVEPVEPVRRYRWLWWLLGIVGGFVLLVCGGGVALVFWASSRKPMEIYNLSAQRQGPTIVIRMNYDIKNRPHVIPFTRVVVEGPGWKYQQSAFGPFMISMTGQITAIVPPDGGQPRAGGSATVYLESESQRGGGMERSSNKGSVTIPPP